MFCLSDYSEKKVRPNQQKHDDKCNKKKKSQKKRENIFADATQ